MRLLVTVNRDDAFIPTLLPSPVQPAGNQDDARL